MPVVVKTWINRGSYGNNEITVWVKDGVSLGLESCGGWKRTENGEDLVCRVSFVPTRAWLMENARKIYEHAGSEAALSAWRDASALMSQLPRVLLPGDAGPGRVCALCSPTDLRMREILKGLGFRWSPQGRVWSLKANTAVGRDVEGILSRWNSSGGPVRFEGRNIFARCAVPLTSEQEETMRYLLNRWEQGWHGGVNGDDMGIGKTYGSLALGALAVSSDAASRIVVVAKTSNIAHWKREWTDKILDASESDVCVFGAARVNSAKARSGGMEKLEEEMSESRLLITNYEYLRKQDSLSLFLKYCAGAVVFFDEAVSMCANHTSATSLAAFKVSCMANFAVPLSGTLEKKNIYEFWSVLRLADPAIYPEKEFNENHLVLETQRLWLKSQKRAIEVETKKYVGEKQFFERISPAYIRHIKNIPTIQSRKVERHFKISRQDSILENRIADGLWRELCSITGSGVTWEQLSAAGLRLPKWQMTALTHLHSAIDDPYTLFESDTYGKVTECADKLALDTGMSRMEAFDYIEGKLQERGSNEYKEQFSLDVVAFARYMESLDPEELKEYRPAKYRFLRKMLREDFPESRVVVFSVFKRTAERVTEMLREDFPGRAVRLITGEASKAKRSEIEDECRDTPGAILVSTDSMAFGTNLQFMDVLVNYNLPWTCDVLKQRNDRIYRTGAEGLKTIVYLTLDSPAEKHKLGVLRRGIENVRSHFGEDISDIPEPTYTYICDYEGLGEEVPEEGASVESSEAYGQMCLFEELVR